MRSTCRPPSLIPLILAASAAAGALFMLGPTLLKLRLGVDEVVTTLLLNFVALLLVGMLLEGPMQDPMSLGWPQSAADPGRRHPAPPGRHAPASMPA